MPLKEIVHGMAKTIAAKTTTLAERTAPEYVPPPPKRDPLTMADKHRLIKIKANIEASAKKLDQIAELLQTAQKEVSVYHLPDFDLSALSTALKVMRRDLTQHIGRLDDALK